MYNTNEEFLKQIKKMYRYVCCPLKTVGINPPIDV